jgi:hypothetical protein
MACNDSDPLRVVPTKMAAKAVGDELKAPEVNGFAGGEATAQ